MKYVDFDLVLAPCEQGYRAEVLDPSSAPVQAEFQLPFTEQELKIFRLEAAQSRRGVRRMESSEMRAAREFGARLFQTVFTGEVKQRFMRSLDDAESASMGLRLRMHLSRAPELADLPWEYLYEPTLGRFFSLSVNTPLVRYLDLPERIKPLPVKPPVQVLAVIASPKDKPPLDVEGEWNKLSKALAGLTRDGMVEVDRLPTPTYAALLKRLRKKPYHIFHFVGHGEFNEECKEGLLLFEDEDGRGSPVSAQALGTLLHDQPSLRLAILNACEGARTSTSDPFAGTAQTLLQQGIPAVIAMQAAITDEAAQKLAYTFYDAIADGYPVDAALTDARKSIFGEGSVEFGTPVLYMRSPDGRIFDVDRLSTEIRRREQKTALVRQADEMVAAKDWPAAVEYLEDLASMDPKNAETAAKLQHARLHQNLTALLSTAREHLEAGRWQESLDVLLRVKQLGGESSEVSSLIAVARGKLASPASHSPRNDDASERPSSTSEAARRPREWAGVVATADLFHEANEALASEDWTKAADKFRAVLAEDPKHAPARDGLERAERQRGLAEVYARAQASLAARRWRDAIDDLRRVRDSDAGFRDVQALLAMARRELDAQEKELAHADSGASVSLPAPPRRKLSTSLKVGGCAVAATLTACALAVVGVLVRSSVGESSQAAERIAAAPTVEPAGPNVDVKPEPEKPVLSKETGRSQAEESLKSTIRAASKAAIQAYRLADVSPLQGYYAGEALGAEIVYLAALAAAGQFAVASLEGQEFKGIQVSPDGMSAQVDVVETWSAQLRWRATGACVAELPSYEMRQSYFLQRAGQRWLITAIRRYSQLPPRRPCGE